MEIIAHRINKIDELISLPTSYGVEIDIRDNGNKLILQHDPFHDGENLEDYLKLYNHGTLILNIKSERIEYRVLELVNKYNIKDYFFLDSSFPMIYQLFSKGEKNIALRYSEFEGIDTIINLKGMLKWVWVDCFTKLPINKEVYNLIKKADYKICLVSPELQGRENDIEKYKNYLLHNNIRLDAVCTKVHNIPKWIKY